MSAPEGITVTWLSENRPPQCAPDPDYPNGKSMDIGGDDPACRVDLPYPAPCVGKWLVKCAVCDNAILVTAAGRPDDPTWVRFPCKTKGTA